MLGLCQSRGSFKRKKRKENRFYQWSSLREDSEFKIKIEFEIKGYLTRKFKGSSTYYLLLSY